MARSRRLSGTCLGTSLDVNGSHEKVNESCLMALWRCRRPSQYEERVAEMWDDVSTILGNVLLLHYVSACSEAADIFQDRESSHASHERQEQPPLIAHKDRNMVRLGQAMELPSIPLGTGSAAHQQ